MKTFVVALLLICFFVPVAESTQTLDQLATSEVQLIKTFPSLKAWMEYQDKIRSENKGYKMQGPKKLCSVMKSVGLGCSYNERNELIMFLYAQGVVLFSCEKDDDFCHGLYNYTGEASENLALTKSIAKNRHLFKNGDLTPRAAEKWIK